MKPMNEILKSSPENPKKIILLSENLYNTMKYLFFTFFLIILDALSKFWALNYLQEELHIIPSFLSLYYVENIGIAFSIPITGLLLKIVTLVLIFGIFWYYWTEEKKKKSLIIDISYSLIFAGAL